MSQESDENDALAEYLLTLSTENSKTVCKCLTASAALHIDNGVLSGKLRWCMRGVCERDAGVGWTWGLGWTWGREN